MPVKLAPRSRTQGFIRNGPAIERALRDMARQVGAAKARTRLGKALRAAAKPVLREVRATTPEDTGALRRSSGIRTLPSRWRKLFPKPPVAAVGIGYWFTRKKHLAFRARSVELGNIRFRRAARHVVTRAFENSVGTVQATLDRELSAIVNEAAKTGARGKPAVRLSGRIAPKRGRQVRSKRIRRSP